MKLDNNQLLNVFFIKGTEKLSMGQLTIKEGNTFFAYDSEFIKTGLNLSPFKLPLIGGTIPLQERAFDGMFGLFNDNIPDGWGRWLLNRKLINMGLELNNLNFLDLLSYVGSHGMGALCYEPEVNLLKEASYIDFDDVAEQVSDFQNKGKDTYLDNLLSLCGFATGARPKIMATIDDEPWIVKFPSFIDPEDIGPIEYTYHLMAKLANLDVPDAKLLPAKQGADYFAIKRFDRIKAKHVHMHTLSGLLHFDYRNPILDYEDVMKTTLRLIKDKQEHEKQFRAAVFNVLVHNRDDHAKNFSFIMDEEGSWKVSPAYDLTFSKGLDGEHCTMVMGEGKNPRSEHLVKLANISQIEFQKALQIIREVKSAASKWDILSKENGVSLRSQKMIKERLDNVASYFKNVE